jgi:hypothetical protein
MAQDKPVYGTQDPDAPITRADFERAIRFLNVTDLEARDTLLRLAAQVVALTDELTRRLDGVEPEPAPANTPATPSGKTVEAAVAATIEVTTAKVRAGDARSIGRVWLEEDLEDKQTVEGPDIPCGELLPLCGARCCKMEFPLSTRDLDEGVIRWDYGRPYMIRQRASDRFCVHNDPATHACTVHAQRPIVCRKYDCRNDERVWLDYEKRIPAPEGTGDRVGRPLDLIQRARDRLNALHVEHSAIVDVFPEPEATVGPTFPDGSRMHKSR